MNKASLFQAVFSQYAFCRINNLPMEIRYFMTCTIQKFHVSLPKMFTYILWYTVCIKSAKRVYSAKIRLFAEYQVSEWLLLNTNSAIFQLYHGDRISTISIMRNVCYIQEYFFYRTLHIQDEMDLTILKKK
jgi:hypothetical protein